LSPRTISATRSLPGRDATLFVASNYVNKFRPQAIRVVRARNGFSTYLAGPAVAFGGWKSCRRGRATADRDRSARRIRADERREFALGWRRASRRTALRSSGLLSVAHQVSPSIGQATAGLQSGMADLSGETTRPDIAAMDLFRSVRPLAFKLLYGFVNHPA